jgi:hypothetical protein
VGLLGAFLVSGAFAGPERLSSLTNQDALSLLRAFVDAVNRGDAESAVGLFAADATWERGGRCPPGACAGLAPIRAEVAMDIRDQHAITIVSVQSSGGAARARIELRTAATRARGVERLIRFLTVNAVDGRIVGVKFEDDLGDPTTAAFVSMQRMQMTPPGTGDGGLVGRP